LIARPTVVFAIPNILERFRTDSSGSSSSDCCTSLTPLLLRIRGIFPDRGSGFTFPVFLNRRIVSEIVSRRGGLALPNFS
jgi:hypothetical protein